MWIAFKIYYLRDTSQRSFGFSHLLNCCELLSKFIIFVTRHNFLLVSVIFWLVVNCFQNLLSSWHVTTFRNLLAFYLVLWIAFKIYYLRDTSQLVEFLRLFLHRCELLSKFIIFVTRHNFVSFFNIISIVVNCFQNLLSSWHVTTYGYHRRLIRQLWIAFKIYYLRDTSQPFL